MWIKAFAGTTALVILGLGPAFGQDGSAQAGPPQQQYGNYNPPPPPQYSYGQPQQQYSGPPQQQYGNYGPPPDQQQQYSYGPQQQPYGAPQQYGNYGPPPDQQGQPQQQYGNYGPPPQSGQPSYSVAGVPQYGAPSAAPMGSSATTSPADVVAFTDASIAGLRAGLKMTADQEKNWAAFEQAARDVAKLRMERAKQLEEEAKPQQASAPASTTAASAAAKPATGTSAAPAAAAAAAPAPMPDTMVEDMQREAAALSSHGAALKKFADALGPLWKSLDDAQKQRFLTLATPIFPQNPAFTF